MFINNFYYKDIYIFFLVIFYIKFISYFYILVNII